MKTVSEAAEDYVLADSMVPDKRNAHAFGVRDAFLAGAEWMRKQFGECAGTTDCIECDSGRASFYTILEGRCIQCAHKRYLSGNKGV